MTKTVTIDQATFNSDELTSFLRRAINVQAEIDSLKEDFKVLVQEAADATKLDKKIARKFFVARFKATTKDIVAEAETLDALSKAVDE
jgi:capsular polysaccharide biosynthesis protein